MKTIQWDSRFSVLLEAQTHRRTDRHNDAN